MFCKSLSMVHRNLPAQSASGSQLRPKSRDVGTCFAGMLHGNDGGMGLLTSSHHHRRFVIVGAVFPSLSPSHFCCRHCILHHLAVLEDAPDGKGLLYDAAGKCPLCEAIVESNQLKSVITHSVRPKAASACFSFVKLVLPDNYGHVPKTAEV